MIPLFAQSLFSFLRADSTAFMLDDEGHPELKDAFSTKKHGPNQVASRLISKINALFIEKKSALSNSSFSKMKWKALPI